MLDLVSIIVPVYNKENYIRKCIESIISQTYTNIEVIFVDDGSVDNSKNIIKSYMHSDKRLKYFYQNNRGPSVARNKGISEANGKFIVFVDSDDWIDSNMIQEMIYEMKVRKSDLVLCDFILETGTKSIYNKILAQKSNIHITELKHKLIKSDSLNSQCNRLYRKEIIDNNNIQFNDKLKVGEDQIFNMEYIGCINKVSYIEKGFYHYRMVTNSTCRKIHKNQIKMLEEQQYIRNNIINLWTNNEEYKNDSAKWFLQNVASYCYLASITLKGEDRKQALNSFIKSKLTEDSLNIIYNKKNTYDINMHKVIIPLIKIKNKFLITLISNIYFSLSHLKKKY